MSYIRVPLSLRDVEELPHARGIDVSYESVRFWQRRFRSINRTGNPDKANGRCGVSAECEVCKNFAAVHASGPNPLNLQCSLYSRDDVKVNRVAALAE